MNANHEDVITVFIEDVGWNVIILGDTMFNGKSGAFEELAVELGEREKSIRLGCTFDDTIVCPTDSCPTDNIPFDKNGILREKGDNFCAGHGVGKVLDV